MLFEVLFLLYISYLRCMFYFIINYMFSLLGHVFFCFLFFWFFLDCTELQIFDGYHLLL